MHIHVYIYMYTLIYTYICAYVYICPLTPVGHCRACAMCVVRLVEHLGVVEQLGTSRFEQRDTCHGC